MNMRFSYALVTVCLLWPVLTWSAQEESTIEKTIRDAVMAAATFSETRDRQAVLRLYSQDYVGIQDGRTETRDSIESWLTDYAAELDRGSTLRFVGAVSGLNVRMTSAAAAWSTYDYIFQAIRKGELEAQDSGQCTALLRKEGSAWLIVHEHCSKPRDRMGM
ncbi:MAG: nuclear transport factor 2 family protein [Nitrospira sp.]|nr:nuclear transport factor 2 family protein [Nitrospira sp.]